MVQSLVRVKCSGKNAGLTCAFVVDVAGEMLRVGSREALLEHSVGLEASVVANVVASQRLVSVAVHAIHHFVLHKAEQTSGVVGSFGS
jgi:hypothetical protein